jgi:hypothetical protein
MTDTSRLDAARSRARAATEAARAEVEASYGLGPHIDATIAADEPRWTVDVLLSARRVIAAEARAADGAGDGCETGGLLFGRHFVSDRYATVFDACGPGSNAVRELDRVVLDVEYGERTAAERGLEVIGGWHTHPGNDPVRHCEISAQDLSACARHFDALRCRGFGAQYVEIIVAPDAPALDWRDQARAYVFTPGENGGPAICERGTVAR